MRVSLVLLLAEHSRIRAAHPTDANTFAWIDGQKSTGSQAGVDGEHDTIAYGTFGDIAREGVVLEYVIDDVL